MDIDNSAARVASHAIEAALELKEIFNTIKNNWIKESDLRSRKVRIKCGIHTGDLLFGIIETDFRNQFDRYSQFSKPKEGSTSSGSEVFIPNVCFSLP